MRKCVSNIMRMILFLAVLSAVMFLPGSERVSAETREVENNDTIAMANVISCNEMITGVISDRDDVDYYKFTLGAPGVVSINFKHENITNNSECWYICLVNEDGQYQWDMESKGTEINKSGSNQGLPAGIYYAYVIRSSLYSAVEYHLTINYAASSYWETEVNDTIATADQIQMNTVYTGVTDWRDKDYYTFTLGAAGHINIHFAHENITSTEKYWTISLLDASSNERLSFSSTGTDINLTSCEYGLAAGTYYILVDAEWYDYSDVDYQLKVSYTASSYWESEPNNSIADADEINLNVVYRGTISEYFDVDYYKFMISRDGDISLAVAHSLIDDDRMCWIATILDASSNEVLKLQSTGKEASKSSQNIHLLAGTYYIKVDFPLGNYYYQHNNGIYAFSVKMADPVSTKIKSGTETYKITKAGVSGGTAALVKSESKASTLKIPGTVKLNGITYKVTSIAVEALKNNKTVTTVTIGNNVKTIGTRAFSGCSKLKKVTIGKNVTTIGTGAFQNCTKLTAVAIGSGVTKIGDKSFYKCSALARVTIPSKVGSIGKQAFFGCKKLKNITIKTKKLTGSTVGKQAFKGISSKAVVKVPGSKMSTYRSILRAAGVGSKVTIKKL